MSIIGSCNSCLLEVKSTDKSINCPDCNRIYHVDCWSKNDSKCSEYGCKGKKEIVETESTDSSTITQGQTGNLNANSSILVNNQDNFRKSNTSPQNKLVIGLLFIIILLFIFIGINFNKNNSSQVAQNNQVIQTPSDIEVRPTYNNSSPVPESTNVYNQSSVEPTPEVTPSPDIDFENSEIKNLIVRSRKIKNEGFLNLDSSEFSSVFTDKALKDYTGGVDWCKENNAYRKTVTKQLNIDEIIRKDDEFEVIASVEEKSDYYENGNFKYKDSFDKFYKVKYKIVKLPYYGFRISDAQVIK